MRRDPVNRPPDPGLIWSRQQRRGFRPKGKPASRLRSRPRAVNVVVYLLAFTVPVIIALSAVGSSPYLLDRVVPDQFREPVAELGRFAFGGSGDDAGSPSASGVGGITVPGAPVPHRDGWTRRHPDDYSPPAGLEPRVDYAVTLSDDGYVAHWPCADEIPVRSFDAPPGSEAHLIWAVETIAHSSDLPLRYAGHGAPGTEDADGAISVTYGDHPDFHGTDIAGVGGPTVWTGGLITQGMVVLRPEQISPLPGDPWSRSLTLHELMHAVGIDHAEAHRPEIMTERSGPDIQTTLGDGDRFALHMVGCR